MQHEERSSPASPQRIARAQQAGFWPISHQVAVAFALLVGLLAIQLYGGMIVDRGAELMRGALSGRALRPGCESVLDGTLTAILRSTVSVLPIILIPTVFLLCALWGQNGFGWPGWRPGVFQFARQQSPAQGFAEAVWDSAKCLAVGGFLAWLVWRYAVESRASSARDFAFPDIPARVALALLAAGLLDYGWRWMVWHRTLRLSNQEQRQEMRDLEPHPLIKAARRERIRIQMTGYGLCQHDLVVVSRNGLASVLRLEEGPAYRLIAKATGRAAQYLVRSASGRGLRVIRNHDVALRVYYGSHAGHRLPQDLLTRLLQVTLGQQPSM